MGNHTVDCEVCGEDLRGLGGGHAPDCGTRSARNDGLPEPLGVEMNGSHFEPTYPPRDASDTVNENPRWVDLDGLRKLWASGFVNRWHCNWDHRLRMSGDMNGGHAQRVAILYFGLFAYRRTHVDVFRNHFTNLMCAILHDAPEVISGDIPQPGKQRVPELKVGDKATEVVYWKQIGNVNWSEKPAEIGLCDLLDAVLFVKQRAPDLLDREDWQGDIEVLLGMARELGLYPEVYDLVFGDWVY